MRTGTVKRLPEPAPRSNIEARPVAVKTFAGSHQLAYELACEAPSEAPRLLRIEPLGLE